MFWLQLFGFGGVPFCYLHPKDSMYGASGHGYAPKLAGQAMAQPKP